MSLYPVKSKVSMRSIKWQVVASMHSNNLYSQYLHHRSGHHTGLSQAIIYLRDEFAWSLCIIILFPAIVFHYMHV